MPERVLLNQTQEEYEEDKISVTSSQSEAYDPDEEFLVERILAEKKKDDGKMQYLISWANYPEDKSTWEPKKNIQDPEILSAWKDRKEQEAKGLESPFDFARFDYRMKQLLQEKEQRCRHRKAKRKQLGIPVSPDPEVRRSRDDDSDSTEAVESDHVPRDSSPETKQKSHKPQKTKKLSKPCVRDSYESEVSDDAVASDDSLIEELLHKNKEKSQKAALRAIRHKRFAPQSKKSGDQNKSFPKESSKVLYTI
jgi:chromo domain-containing protein 1